MYTHEMTQTVKTINKFASDTIKKQWDIPALFHFGTSIVSQTLFPNLFMIVSH